MVSYMYNIITSNSKVKHNTVKYFPCNIETYLEDVFLCGYSKVCFGDTQVGVQVRVCVWAEFMCLCRGCVLKAFSHSRGCRTAQSECIFTDGV